MMGPLYSGAAVGADGSATANADTNNVVSGRIVAVGLSYLETPPAGTTDVVVATKGTNGPAQTILAISNAATDGWFYPRVGTTSTSGAAMLYAAGGTAVGEPPAINDVVNVKIDGANAGDGVNVWLLME
jgi:hypothetical protein